MRHCETMRYNIYYRKCDSPMDNLFKDKYSDAGIEHLVRQICPDAAEIRPLNCDGNHYAYYVNRNSRPMLFRADTSPDDEYMLAETALMKLAHEAGVPVPQVYDADTSMRQVPCRWQLLEWIPYPNLEQIDRKNELNRPEIACQLGHILKRLHSVRLEGYGFINTDILQRNNQIKGIYQSYREYFLCCLDSHLAYLNFHSDKIREILERIPEPATGSLVHRDPAFWNILGKPDQIVALIDWDDAVSGDPADDLGMLWCFHDRTFMEELLAAYGDINDEFRHRIDLHYLRNMLWKTVLRDRMGYFNKNSDFFLNTGNQISLKELTYQKLNEALKRCESW